MNRHNPQYKNIITNNSFRYLVSYYGILQILHLIALCISAVLLLNKGSLDLLAPPPLTGWSRQIRYFFIGMGIIDAINAGLSLVFVSKFLRKQIPAIQLGWIVLSIAVYSGAIYAITIVLSGAFLQNILTYSIIGTLFIPIIVLFLLFVKNTIIRPRSR